MGKFQAKYLLILAEMTVLLCTQYMVHKRVETCGDLEQCSHSIMDRPGQVINKVVVALSVH